MPCCQPGSNGAEPDVMEKWHGSQDSPRVPLPWWNPTSGRVLQREPVPSAPGGRAPPRYRSAGWCRGRLSSFPRYPSLHGLGFRRSEASIHNIFTRVLNAGRFSPSHTPATYRDFEYPTALWLITKNGSGPIFYRGRFSSTH